MPPCMVFNDTKPRQQQNWNNELPCKKVKCPMANPWSVQENNKLDIILTTAYDMHTTSPTYLTFPNIFWEWPLLVLFDSIMCRVSDFCNHRGRRRRAQLAQNFILLRIHHFPRRYPLIRGCHNVKNTSLAKWGALVHHLQRHAACNTAPLHHLHY